MLTAIAVLDELLEAHSGALGADFTGYRNHAYRVANLCLAQTSDASSLERIAIAAAFHDMGIWTDGTLYYLAPSVTMAEQYLSHTGRSEWTAEISAMIREHHKISPYRDDPHWLVEPFRRADWIDVSRGLISFGVPRRLLREVFAAWPSAGFHARLVQLELARLRSHPLNPLPMMKL